MNHLETLDPQLKMTMEHTLTAHLPDGDLTVSDIREAEKQAAASFPPNPSHTQGLEVRSLVLSGVPCVACQPLSEEPLPVLIWLHGGGMIMGSADGSIARACRLASDIPATVILPDYRLAPEHPYPAAVTDAIAVIKAVSKGALGPNFDHSRLAVSGISAGANLAAASTLSTCEQVDISLLLLLCPMLDDRPSLESDDDWRPQWNGRLSRAAWSAYLGGRIPGGPDVPWQAAPGRAPRLESLPPMYMDLGSLDPFLEEDLQFATKAAAQGVSLELHVFPGAVHAWDSLAPDSTLSTQAHLLRVQSLQKHLHPNVLEPR